MSGATGISTRSGLADGMNIPTVRLAGFKYILATRCTSSGVTACSRSRETNSIRQSPIDAHSVKLRAMDWVLVIAKSRFFAILAFARSTAALSYGLPPASSKMAKRFVLTSSNDWFLSSMQPKTSSPGSASLCGDPPTFATFFESTRALYRIPEG